MSTKTRDIAEFAEKSTKMNDERPFERLLEDVAREWDLHACGDDTCELEGADCLADYLKRRLLPLLKAGEDTAKYCKNLRGFLVSRFGFQKTGEGVDEVWDKQKQAAMEGR